jgi:hypothetical protein
MQHEAILSGPVERGQPKEHKFARSTSMNDSFLRRLDEASLASSDQQQATIKSSHGGSETTKVRSYIPYDERQPPRTRGHATGFGCFLGTSAAGWLGCTSLCTHQSIVGIPILLFVTEWRYGDQRSSLFAIHTMMYLLLTTHHYYRSRIVDG